MLTWVPLIQVRLTLSEFLEGGEQGVAGRWNRRKPLHADAALERLLFGFHVRINLDFCRLRTLGAQPEHVASYLDGDRATLPGAARRSREPSDRTIPSTRPASPTFGEGDELVLAKGS
jgi:hypothetical protein